MEPTTAMTGMGVWAIIEVIRQAGRKSQKDQGGIKNEQFKENSLFGMFSYFVNGVWYVC